MSVVGLLFGCCWLLGLFVSLVGEYFGRSFPVWFVCWFVCWFESLFGEYVSSLVYQFCLFLWQMCSLAIRSLGWFVFFHCCIGWYFVCLFCLFRGIVSKLFEFVS